MFQCRLYGWQKALSLTHKKTPPHLAHMPAALPVAQLTWWNMAIRRFSWDRCCWRTFLCSMSQHWQQKCHDEQVWLLVSSGTVEDRESLSYFQNCKETKQLGEKQKLGSLVSYGFFSVGFMMAQLTLQHFFERRQESGFFSPTKLLIFMKLARSQLSLKPWLFCQILAEIVQEAQKLLADKTANSSAL